MCRAGLPAPGLENGLGFAATGLGLGATVGLGAGAGAGGGVGSAGTVSTTPCR